MSIHQVTRPGAPRAARFPRSLLGLLLAAALLPSAAAHGVAGEPPAGESAVRLASSAEGQAPQQEPSSGPELEADRQPASPRVRDHRTGGSSAGRGPRTGTGARPITPPRSGNGSTRGPRTGSGSSSGNSSGNVIRSKPRDPESVLAVQSWVGQAASVPLPARLPRRISTNGSLQPVTLLLGEELVLAGGSWSSGDATAPRNLVLIADRLVIRGQSVIDLSGTSGKESATARLSLLERSGGDLLIMARELVCEPGGKLTFRSAGRDGPAKVSVRDHTTNGPSPLGTRKAGPRYGGGHGGDLTLAVESLRLAPVGDEASIESELDAADGLSTDRLLAAGCLAWEIEGHPGGEVHFTKPTEIVPGPDGAAGSVRLFSRFRDAVVALETETLRPFGLAFGKPAVSTWARRAASRWQLEMLDVAIADIRLADLGGIGGGSTTGRSEAVRRLRRAVALAGARPPIEPDSRPALEERLVELQQLRDRFASSLWRDSLTIHDAGGLPRRVELFTEGRDLLTRIAPTHLLVLPRRAGGRSVLGLIEHHPEQDDALRLELEVELAVDPWLADRAARALRARGEAYGGVFTGWQLTGLPLATDGGLDGIRDSEVQVAATGDRARVSLVLDAGRASLVLARLAASSGLPLSFSWRYRDDLNVDGIWQAPPLTLLSRGGPPPVTVGRGFGGETLDVINSGGREVTVEYVQVGGDDGQVGATRFVALSPPLLLAAGEAAALPATAAEKIAALQNGATDLSVPLPALTYSGTDPFRLAADFQLLAGDELIETVTVTNLLGHDEELGGGLEYVEIELAYRSGGGDEIAAGPYRLAPVGADGDRVAVSFVKPTPGTRTLRLTGTAVYEGGSSQRLAETTFDDLAIQITRELLPALAADAGTDSQLDLPMANP